VGGAEAALRGWRLPCSPDAGHPALPGAIMRTSVHVAAATALAFFALSGSCSAFELKSNLRKGQQVPADYYQNNFGCTGKSVSPRLEWSPAPKGTRSFAITLFDRSAPTGSGFWHYVAYDIPADTTKVEVGDLTHAKLPAGAKEGNTDLGKPGYFGPCPPVGRQHTYVYTVHALKTEKLGAPDNASPALVGFHLWQNSLGKVELPVVAGPRK
jgi:Raf kinase inhibitor-like YbhB/YbcL family protein